MIQINCRREASFWDRAPRAGTFGIRSAVAALAALAALPAVAAELTPVKAGISDPVNTVLDMYMAKAAGFYQARGLDVDIVNMNGGSRGAAELQAGRLDIMHVGMSSVVKANLAGGDLRSVAALSNLIRFVLFSPATVKTAAQLKGGVIGVSTFGSESDTTATLALQRLGLTRADVTVKEYGGGVARLAAIKSGEIAASPLNEPFTSLALEQGLHPLVDLVTEKIPWLFSSVVVRRADITGRRDLIKRFLAATAEGNYLALSDEARAKQVLAQELKITDAKILDISYRDFKAQSPPDIEILRAGAINILAQFPQVGDKGGDKLDGFVDTGLIDDLKRDGTFAALQKQYGRK